MSALVRQLPLGLALTLVVLVASAQGSGVPPDPSASSDGYDETVGPMVDVLTHEGTGKAIEEMQSSVEKAKQTQDNLQQGVEKAVASRSGAARRAGKKLVEESKAVSAEYAKELSWLDKLKKAAEIVDVVSTGSQAAGYLAEGDPSGAVTVVVDDVCKKVCAAGGAAALAWIPGVGSIAGAAAGEEAYKEYVRPKLVKRDQERREQAAKDAQLNQWLRKEKVIDSEGNVRELDIDWYYDRATGLIKQRPPDEQARWLDQQRRDFFDAKKLQAIREDYLHGKLPKSEYLRAVEDFKRRDRSKLWEPPSLQYNSGDAGAQSAILDFVKPQRVTATASGRGSVTMTFWNVGNLAPGYGEATAVTTHRNGTETARGTFSGGPNGRFSFQVGRETIALRLVDGKTVQHNLGTLMVQNPAAFDNWPAGL